MAKIEAVAAFTRFDFQSAEGMEHGGDIPQLLKRVLGDFSGKEFIFLQKCTGIDPSDRGNAAGKLACPTHIQS
jgi:hypothetical protein